MAPWKPVLTALLLPPVPLLLLTLVGARMIFWRRLVGWTVLLLAVVGLWLSACIGAGEWLQRMLLRPPAPLRAEEITELKKNAARQRTAIVVLGGGMEPLAPEYGMSNLTPLSAERLRYGLWLSRETGLPVAFTGGLGHAQDRGVPEAEVAARIAAREYGRPLKWTETQSRDTRENAGHTLPLLKAAGIERIVLVTHGFHMTRALRVFRQVASESGSEIAVDAAPMGLAHRSLRPSLRWLPSGEGTQLNRQVWREWVGLAMGV